MFTIQLEPDSIYTDVHQARRDLIGGLTDNDSRLHLFDQLPGVLQLGRICYFDIDNTICETIIADLGSSSTT